MMLCFFHKYRISRSLDTQTPPGRFTENHLAHCDQCRRFHARARAMGEQLQRDADGLALTVPDALHVRILAHCGLTADAEADAADPASQPQRPRPAPRMLRLRPAWILAFAAMLLLAVGASYFLPAGKTPTTPGPHFVKKPTNKTPQDSPPSIEDSPLAIVVDLTRRPRPVDVDAVDRPLTDEMDRLREQGKITAEFLLSCVPVDLGLETK